MHGKPPRPPSRAPIWSQPTAIPVVACGTCGQSSGCREVVEHPFGSIKQRIYQGAFLMRGLAKARAEFSLSALAYNLHRVLGVETMTAAVAA